MAPGEKEAAGGAGGRAGGRPVQRPRITPLENGPLLYENPLFPDAGNVYDHRMEELKCGSRVKLCRCGFSERMPFCDSSHEKVGFTEGREHDPARDRRKDYVGELVTVHDNRYICAHAGYCWERLPEVFATSDKPWIHPDAAGPERILEIIELCPSGALACTIDGEEYVDFEREPRIKVARNGPYNVVGFIELVGGDPRPDRASREHYTLCRCGRSRNKPFCDGSHEA